MSSRSPAVSESARRDFRCRNRERVSAVDGELVEYVHGPTGARHLHLHLPIDESAFLMAIATPAPDSSGLTHVLEHLVMCGSERYPCRRAFFAMLGRTLSTTMNALTTEDCTAFHFATRSLADYENLLSVYLDAAFFPRLDRLDFDQEGCRVELDATGGDEAAPVRRGVVLSEMRGLMSDPGHQLQQALNRNLFPVSHYRFNSGGDPWEMPVLDLETLKTYHQRHYQPGNTVFLSAGPLEPEWLHVRLHDLVLSRSAPCELPGARLPERPAIPPLEAPSRTEVRYPSMRTGTPTPIGASMGIAWRLGETSNPTAKLRATLLARCLLEQHDAPVRRALRDAPGSSAAALAPSGVQATRSRLVLQCGVHGCDPDRANDIESMVFEAIDVVARDGLDETRVAGALAQIERELRERHDPRYPFPLKLLTRLLPAALYGGESAAALNELSALEQLRVETRSRKGVADLVRSCLRDNPERVSVMAIPDPDAARRLDRDDRALLMRDFGPSCGEARKNVVARSRALRRRQDSSAGESSLPRLDLAAVGPPREPPEFYSLPAAAPHEGTRAGPPVGPGTARCVGSTNIPRIWISHGATGGLTYVRLAIDIPELEPDALDDVGLLAEILPESGHGRLNPAETRARLARICDRLEVEPRLLTRTTAGPHASGAGASRAVLVLSARALAADEEVLLEALADARLDARIGPGARTCAARARARRTSELARHGHLHAERVAAAHLGPLFAADERWHGPSALPTLGRAADGAADGTPLEERLHGVHRALAAAPFQVHVVRNEGDRRSLDSNRIRRGHPPETGGTVIGARTRHAPESSNGSGPRLHPEPAVGAWVIEGPVNYCARVYPAVTPDHPDAGPLAVLAASLGGDLLQPAVRERGGAYGTDARYCERTGTFRVFSYRDPRLAGTLHDFDQAIAALRRRPPDGQRLEGAVLRAVRAIDKPKAFQVDAFERFLDELQGWGVHGRAALRASALDAGPERLRDVALRYLSPDLGRTGVLAGTGRESELDRLGIPWRRL